MEANSVVETIKKLLDMSQSQVNIHEAQVAAMKAQRLIAKYDIKITDLQDPTEQDFDYVKSRDLPGKNWKYNLAHIIAPNFRCKHFWYGKSKCCFYGFPRDAEAALMVYEFIFIMANKAANNEVYRIKKLGYTTKDIYKSFITGFLCGLKDNLNAQSKELMIIIPETLEDSYSEFMKDAKTRKTSFGLSRPGNSASYKNGYDLGKSAMQRRELQASV